VYDDGTAEYHKMPVKNELNYTKSKQWINRIDMDKLIGIFSQIILNKSLSDGSGMFAVIERPMVNPMRFKASVSALRALEATLLSVEQMGMKYRYIDSKEWQKELLPKGLKKEELKEASMQVGKRLFPEIDLKKFKDADGLLIAEYQRRIHKI